MNIAKINAAVNALAESDKFSGSVLLNDAGGNALYAYACGDASKAYGIRNTLDTKYNIASVGKPITGVAVAMLVAQQALAVSDVVSAHIQLKNSIFDTITIEHLLTHTSGLGDYFAQAYSAAYTESYENLNDFLPIVEGATLHFSPGNSWKYSNLGYLVLGLLIEKLTGMTYDAYIQRHIFQPAAMQNSGFWLCNEPVHNRATGYSFDYDRHIWRSRISVPVLRGTSAGGWYSTVEDLSKFMHALLTNKLLSPPHTQTVVTAKPEVNAPAYGYGFFVSDDRLRHGGDGNGISAQLVYYKASGYTLAVLGNYTSCANDVVNIFDQEILSAKARRNNQ